MRGTGLCQTELCLGSSSRGGKTLRSCIFIVFREPRILNIWIFLARRLVPHPETLATDIEAPAVFNKLFAEADCFSSVVSRVDHPKHLRL